MRTFSIYLSTSTPTPAFLIVSEYSQTPVSCTTYSKKKLYTCCKSRYLLYSSLVLTSSYCLFKCLLANLLPYYLFFIIAMMQGLLFVPFLKLIVIDEITHSPLDKIHVYYQVTADFHSLPPPFLAVVRSLHLHLFSQHKTHTHTETLCLEQKYYCEVCHSKQEAQKRMRVKKLPSILALHLKRFKYVEQFNRYTKLSHRVVFPLELRLFNTSHDAYNPDRLYDLVAVVVHCGSGPNRG